MKSLIVRAGLEHLDRVTPLFGAYRRFYSESVDAAAERRFLEDRLTRDESVIFLAIDENDTHTACGFVQLYPGFDSVILASVWVLHDLYVAEQYRRAGIGRALMTAAHTFCRASGASRVDLATAVTNERAKPLYVSMGYELDDEFDYFSLSLK